MLSPNVEVNVCVTGVQNAAIAGKILPGQLAAYQLKWMVAGALEPAIVPFIQEIET
jgi:hypothetical protein